MELSMILSRLSHGIQTSPIITLAAEINEKIQRGEKIYNLTIGTQFANCGIEVFGPFQ
jgi:hypothetical protein